MYEACSAWSWFPKGGHVSLQLRICLYHDSAMERGTFVLTFYFLNIWDYNYTAYGKWFAYPFFSRGHWIDARCMANVNCFRMGPSVGLQNLRGMWCSLCAPKKNLQCHPGQCSAFSWRASSSCSPKSLMSSSIKKGNHVQGNLFDARCRFGSLVFKSIRWVKIHNVTSNCCSS